MSAQPEHEIFYAPTTTQEQFMLSDSYVRLLGGPIGCVRGDTLIATEEGLLPIEKLTRPVRVLSWNAKTGQYQLSSSGGAFPKGRDYLYRVVTQRGEWHAAAHHRVLCADGRYRPVQSLSPGQSLHRYCDAQQPTISDLCRKLSLTDEPRWIQTAVDSLVRYAESARQYGQQLLSASDSGLAFAPSPSGAPECISTFDPCAPAQMGGQQALTQERSRPNRLSDHPDTRDSLRRSVPLPVVWACRICASVFSRACGWFQASLRSLRLIAHRQPAQEFSSTKRPYSNSSTNETIISVERLPVKHVYWDMQVLDTNNYVTSDGAVHHNSGKSVTCVHELIRWSTEQLPNKAGIRKTRFLIVRNTADQLKSTTLKTIFDWIPPSWAGSWSVTDKTFYIRFGLGDGTVVESEWMAIALDTPDDVRKALSLEATGLWGNESRELHPDVVDGLLMRVNRYPSMKDGGPTRPGAIFDTNMPQMGGWWFEKMSNPPSNWSVHIQPPAVLPLEDWQAKYGVGKKKWARGDYTITADSDSAGRVEVRAKRPGHQSAKLVCVDTQQNVFVVDHAADNFQNLNPSYYPNTLEGKTEEFINVYLRCMFGQSKEGRPVFEGFRRDFHAAKNQLTPIDDPNRPLIIGMDFGLTPACTISQVDPRGRLLTFAEITSSNMGIYRFITEKLRPMLSERFSGLPVIVVGDPAGVQRSQTDEKTVYDILQEEGFKAQPAPSNALSRRLAAVEKFLARVVDGTPAHVIDPSCKVLIGGLSGGYRFRMKKSGDMEDRPEKNDYSHLMDGHQYTCLFVDGGMAPGGRLETGRSQRREVKVVSMGAWL